ncbi:hypothetical protein MA16_Dca006331 [Dendrobium catenatum]|uniref:Uncharacterized protein n=1 Tax=Dendrobium catenatum TaxID=906689 RepID=A0A2I0W9K8_9ASPA|nr:hypothetical protein MA16_Dca006331 [Dendrobium catenatum]
MKVTCVGSFWSSDLGSQIDLIMKKNEGSDERLEISGDLTWTDLAERDVKDQTLERGFDRLRQRARSVHGTGSLNRRLAESSGSTGLSGSTSECDQEVNGYSLEVSSRCGCEEEDLVMEQDRTARMVVEFGQFEHGTEGTCC